MSLLLIKKLLSIPKVIPQQCLLVAVVPKVLLQWYGMLDMRWDGLVVSVSASHVVGRGFAFWLRHTKDQHKIGTNCHPAWHARVRVGV